MAIEKILVVDDDGNVRSLLFDLLQEMNCSVSAVASIAQARELFLNDTFDLVISDVRLSDGDGLDFLLELRKQNPLLKMIVMTGFASMDTAVKAIRVGVFDYLIKPIDPGMLDAAIRRLNSLVRLEAENQYLRDAVSGSDMQGIIWGKSEAMKEVCEMVAKVAPTETTVLIQGESGTGKEVVAHSICNESARAQQPFIKVNCAAVPPTLMESEFFGHEKGAFTGAVQRRQGRFELADSGTLLLDEITEIPIELQVKLLRVLQEREFERVGGQKTIHVNVRVIATTNRDLSAEVAAGRFREDLFYRLNVFPIHLPPLRERGNDLLVLAKHFLLTFSRRHGKELEDFSQDALAHIGEYPWPGNVRELQNMIERAVILAAHGQMVLSSADIPLPTRFSSGLHRPSAANVTISNMEFEMIRQVLKECSGNRTHAAKKLGISLRTLRNRLRDYRNAGIAVE